MYSATAQVEKDTRTSLASQTSKIIEDKLHEIIRNDTVSVSYKNMEVDMNETWHVAIAGWPSNIPITCPSSIKGTERLRIVRDGWLSGAINWVAMEPEEIEALNADLAKQRAKNGGVLKKRKTRTDVGGKHSKGSKGKGKGSKGKGKAREEREDEESEVGSGGDNDDDDDEDNSTPPPRAPSTRLADAAAANTVTSTAAAPVPSALASPIPGPTTAAPAAVPNALASPFPGPMLADADASAIPGPTLVASSLPTALSNVDGAPPPSFIQYAPSAPSASVAFVTTSFIQYAPPAPLRDRSNGKRKAPATGELADAPVKKARKKRADAGIPRGPRGGTMAGASTSGSAATSGPCPTPKPLHRPGSGYMPPTASKSKHRDDDVTRRVTEQMKEEAAARRAAGALASQLPPSVEPSA